MLKIDVSDNELEVLHQRCSHLLTWIEKLSEVNVVGVGEYSHSHLESFVREDIPKNPESKSDLMNNSVNNDFFIVPNVFSC